MKKGICHGVRTGNEVYLCQDVIGGSWVGTEIVEELCDGDTVIYHDFSIPKDNWLGAFDIVYSNSFDHSRDYYKTIKTWLDQLTNKGRIYVEWTPWHERLGKRGNLADCFAATLEEVLEIFNSVGEAKVGVSIPCVSRKGTSYLRHIIEVSKS